MWPPSPIGHQFRDHLVESEGIAALTKRANTFCPIQSHSWVRAFSGEHINLHQGLAVDALCIPIVVRALISFSIKSLHLRGQQVESDGKDCVDQ
jgi:hypothetical protein